MGKVKLKALERWVEEEFVFFMSRPLLFSIFLMLWYIYHSHPSCLSPFLAMMFFMFWHIHYLLFKLLKTNHAQCCLADSVIIGLSFCKAVGGLPRCAPNGE